ncbi:hypothetical protein PUN28_001597 [Cardiocondyla obscurior]|uniref:Uncharacterized protein n=1 Tax=Cardiocondyla obscurior TaxID=286306 RepID=A0AAW2GQB3_9HYME
MSLLAWLLLTRTDEWAESSARLLSAWIPGCSRCCCDQWNNYSVSAEMVAVDHYLYAGAVVGFNRILGTYFVRGDWVWSIGEGDVYGASLWKLLRKQYMRGEVG